MEPMEKTMTVTVKPAVAAYSSSPASTPMKRMFATIPPMQNIKMNVPNASAKTCGFRSYQGLSV